MYMYIVNSRVLCLGLETFQAHLRLGGRNNEMGGVRGGGRGEVDVIVCEW